MNPISNFFYQRNINKLNECISKIRGNINSMNQQITNFEGELYSKGVSNEREQELYTKLNVLIDQRNEMLQEEKQAKVQMLQLSDMVQ